MASKPKRAAISAVIANAEQPEKWSEMMRRVLQSDTTKPSSDRNRPKTIKKKKIRRRAVIAPANDSGTKRATANNAESSALNRIVPSALLSASDIAVVDNSAAKIEKERNLRNVATRGVVQLFNMLKKQQTAPTPAVELKPVAKAITRLKDSGLQAVTPRSFLELLAQSSRMQRQAGESHVSKVASTTIPLVSTHASDTRGVEDEFIHKASSKETDAEKPKWNVLRNDYMMNAHLKDWDQTADSEDDDAET